MARPNKEGLDFFYLDCFLYAHDDAVELIETKYGVAGFGLLIRLLMKIHGDKGYYAPWGEKELLNFSRKIGSAADWVAQVVADCLRENIFSQTQFERYKILTSEAIQDRYFAACERRKGVSAIKEYLLRRPNYPIIYVSINGVNVNINEVNVPANPINDDINGGKWGHDDNINPQSKVKKSIYIYPSAESSATTLPLLEEFGETGSGSGSEGDGESGNGSAKKSRAPIFEVGSAEYMLALKLRGYVSETLAACNLPNCALPEETPKGMSVWAYAIDLLIRKSGGMITPERVGQVMEWIFNSDHRDAIFWRRNIRSGDALRKQFEKIVIAMKQDTTARIPQSKRGIENSEIDEEMRRLAEKMKGARA